jgi:ABC-2 type transport system ATP-binding protein
VRILTTLLAPDSGHARVAGFDVVASPQRVRARIGVAGQTATMDELLSGRQNLDTIGRLFHLSATEARRRAAELLDRFGLADAGDRLVRTYSGGMRRRLDLAASLVAEPPVLFLDEPTTGLDPISRTQIWAAIRTMSHERGTTVLLTTQYLDEAEQLADSVVVIDDGVVAATGTPSELKVSVGAARVRVVLRDPGTEHAEQVRRLLGLPAASDGRAITLPAPDGLDSLAAVIEGLRASGARIEHVGLEHPSLEEAFTILTGEPNDRPDVPAPAGAR